MIEHFETLIKVLSSNDVGETGGHQAGIVVPRVGAALAFFPALDVDEFNPRATVSAVDVHTGTTMKLNYIYYNGRNSGRSTRNEYRLTGLTRYLRERNAQAGDSLVIIRDNSGVYTIAHERQHLSSMKTDDGEDIVVLSGTWHTIKKGSKF